MTDIKEKISAFYDGELNLSSEEIDELITFINENPVLLEQISMMALTTAIKDNEDSNLISINSNKKNSNIFARTIRSIKRASPSIRAKEINNLSSLSFTTTIGK